MMPRIWRCTGLLVSWALLGPVLVIGQPTPVSEVIPLCGSYPADVFGTVLCQELRATPLHGGWGLAWTRHLFDADPTWQVWTGLVGRRGRFAQQRLVADSPLITLRRPWITSIGDGNSAVAWTSSGGFGSRAMVQRLDADPELPLKPPAALGEGVCNEVEALASSADGGYTVGWTSQIADFAPCDFGSGLSSTRTWLQSFDAEGRETNLPFPLPASGLEPAPQHPVSQLLRGLLIDQVGAVTALWTDSFGLLGQPEATFHIRLQRFSPLGLAIGGTVDLPGFYVGMTASAATGITLAWRQTPDAPILLSRFSPDLRQIGDPRDLSLPSRIDSLVSDRNGNLALAWSDATGLWLALLNQDLVKQGEPALIEQSPQGAPGSLISQLILADGGRLFVSWSGHRTLIPGQGNVYSILSEIWQARHDADLCVWRNGTFLCDTAGDGGAEDTVIEVSVHLQRTPLVADFNGDGRADPCLFANGSFACDPAHDDSPPSLTFLATKPQDTPLLGDVDGDGKADPCRWTNQSLFECQTRAGHRFRSRFGQPGDVPVLGDVDGNGTADPCVYRKGSFLCDTVHDGGRPEITLRLTAPFPGAVTPLLGDIDGDGRADACLAQPPFWVCGIFGAQGGLPIRVIRKTYGQAGDTPLLGDLDGF